MGRPRKGSRVFARVPDEIRAAADAAAARRGWDLSTWVAWAISRAVEKEEAIMRPVVESVRIDEADEYAAVVVATVRRGNEVGEVWVHAGIPEADRGTWDASGRGPGMADVWAFGDSPDQCCPDWLQVEEAVELVRRPALREWRDRS